MTAGKTIPAPGNGDQLQNRSARTVSSYNVVYEFKSSIVIDNVTYSNVWVLYVGFPNGSISGTYNVQSWSSFRSTSYPVVQVRLYSNTYTKISTLGGTIPTTVKNIFFGTVAELTQITATLPSSLLTLNLRDCPRLASVPTLSNGLKKLNLSNCTALTTVPTLPSTINDLTEAFKGCTNLTGIITINSTIADCIDAFAGTTKAITLVGSSQSLQQLANTANNNNVYVGFKVSVNSLTSIRCNSAGVAYEEGDYALLTVGWTAHTGSNVYASRVIVKANGVELSNVTWYSDRALTQPITFPEVLASSGTKYALLPTDDSAKGISVEVETTYSTYTWLSPIIYTTLTGKAFILDISRDGKSIALFTSANDGVTDNELILGLTGMPISIMIAGVPIELHDKPVGTCFIGDSDLDPNEFLGGEWSVVTGVSVGTNNSMWKRTT